MLKKMIKEIPEPKQHLIDSSLTHIASFHQVSYKSIP